MSRRTFVIALLIGLCLSLAYISWHNTPTAFTMPHNQTVPTRTPTSAPATATQPPDNGGGSPGNTPAPTNTPDTNPTATQLPVTLAATQEGSFVATAVPCGGVPTVQALNTIFVRAGPGTDYEALDTLVYLEVRPIVGRAADAAWWLIELPTGQRGWVADAVVDVQGYIAIVPIAVSPPIAVAGSSLATPTPGAPWNPTPLPNCTVTPTATLTALPTPTRTATAIATEEPTAVPTATPTATASPTATATVGAEMSSEIASVDITPPPTAAPLNVEATTSAANILPIAAVLLLAAGVAVILVRRRGRHM